MRIILTDSIMHQSSNMNKHKKMGVFGKKLIRRLAKCVCFIGLAVVCVPSVYPQDSLNVEDALKISWYDNVPLDPDLCGTIMCVSDQYNVPEALIVAVIDVESNFQEDCVSSKGCYGLMQLNPKHFPSGLSSSENIRYGTEYLSKLMDKYSGDIRAALTSYNAGHDTGNRTYANSVLKSYNYWRSLDI